MTISSVPSLVTQACAVLHALTMIQTTYGAIRVITKIANPASFTYTQATPAQTMFAWWTHLFFTVLPFPSTIAPASINHIFTMVITFRWLQYHQFTALSGPTLLTLTYTLVSTSSMTAAVWDFTPMSMNIAFLPFESSPAYTCATREHSVTTADYRANRLFTSLSHKSWSTFTSPTRKAFTVTVTISITSNR
ncbi:unnamed protein product [Haemonchus placei]|uniref:7TM_GPCR_Srx domain-containing protein n=1 Tax=Haemonchus placei TaxID=6290 RepID=A0A0N4VSZ1_HAEPC|nr:unnamed protein product [Haemonchus placei]